MPRVIVESSGRAFFREQYLELALESKIEDTAHFAFHEYKYFQCKPRIFSPFGPTHPDGVLLSTVDDTWWIVEVELSEHSVERHIKPQLQKQSSGKYGEQVKKYLATKYDSTNFDSDYAHINFTRPNFMLMIDEATTTVRDFASSVGFSVLQVQPYLDDAGTLLIVYDGEINALRTIFGEEGPITGMFETGSPVPCFIFENTQPSLTLPSHVTVGSGVHKLRISEDRYFATVACASDRIEQEFDCSKVHRLEKDGTFTELPNAN